MNETVALYNSLIEHYREILIKNQNYQMGDDNYELTTEEHRICDSLLVILNDLKRKIN